MLLANPAIPMIFVELPLLVVALIPIVMLEAAVYRWRLAVPRSQALWCALKANLWSTLVGVPFAWFTQFMAQTAVVGPAQEWKLDTPLERLAAVTLQSAWLPLYDADELRWMIPAASLFLLLPFLVVSVAIEQLVLRRSWSALPGRGVVVATILANLLSYIALALYWGAFILIALGTRPAYEGVA